MLSVIISTHNRVKEFDSCLKAILPLKKYENIYILLILDGYHEQIWKIANEFAYKNNNVIIYTGNGDLFWGGSIALGMHNAFDKLCSKAVLWLNEDSTFHVTDILDIYSVHIEIPRAILGGKLVATNLNNTPIYPEGKLIQKGLWKVPYLNGNFTLIPRVVYETVGNIDSVRFPHFADAPFLEKARKYGFECFVVDKIEIGIQYDIIRHLPLFCQALSFKGTYTEFLIWQISCKKSKWFLPYRWNYTQEKFQLISLMAFFAIFLRDYIPVMLIFPFHFLSFEQKNILTLWAAQLILRLPEIQLQELAKELKTQENL